MPPNSVRICLLAISLSDLVPIFLDISLQASAQDNSASEEGTLYR